VFKLKTDLNEGNEISPLPGAATVCNRISKAVEKSVITDSRIGRHEKGPAERNPDKSPTIMM
jgi:hypothetical protein